MKKKLNLVVLLLMIMLVLYFTLKDDFSSVVLQLRSVNLVFLLLAVMIMTIALLFKSASLRQFISQRKSYSLKSAFNINLIAQFLNGITPFQTGGQPFQIYLLKKENVRVADSTASLVKDFITYQIALIFMGILAFVLNHFSRSIKISGVSLTLITLGFGINLIVLIFLFLIIFAKTTGIKILNFILDFLFRFKIFRKIIKDKNKINDSIEQFYNTGIELRENKDSFIKGLTYNVLYLLLLYSIPMLIFNSVGVSDINIIQTIIATSFIMLIGNFIPIPGATGGIEYGFMLFFGVFVTGPKLASTMLLWRFITYILGLIVGAIALFCYEGGKNK